MTLERLRADVAGRTPLDAREADSIRRFLRAGGKRALITSPWRLPDAMEGRAGTHFVGKL